MAGDASDFQRYDRRRAMAGEGQRIEGRVRHGDVLGIDK